MTVVVAEKPAVGRDLAKVLGARNRAVGYLEGSGYIVTWAIGHLVTLAQPHEMNPDWRVWRRDRLPILPKSWPLVVNAPTKDQFDVVRRLLRDPKTERVICATDAGREGELIFRYIYEASGCKKPVSRLWISSLTREAIEKGFRQLSEQSLFDPLAKAALGRSRADWLVGMNLSRACSIAHDEKLTVGRVQTPTLAMVVERELAIERFVPESYHEIIASFAPLSGPQDRTLRYTGTFFNGKTPSNSASRLSPDQAETDRIVARALKGEAAVQSMRSETRRLPPPLLYDLTELQRHANRLYGMSARTTLSVAQRLYEQHKLISYPRTDSRHLSQDVAAGLGKIVDVIAPPYREHLAEGTGTRPLGSRFVNDARITDHHAIIPTSASSAGQALGSDELRLYDLICRRLLEAWHPDHVSSHTTVITAITTPSFLDRYLSRGTLVLAEGWKVLEPGNAPPPTGPTNKEPLRQELPPGLTETQPQRVLEAKHLEKKTKPPRRFTDASLLTAMETAGETLDDRELSEAMRERGLGTPATRAETIETLLKRDYLVRSGKSLQATRLGIRLIEVVHPQVKSPAMTGQWEAQLKLIQRGKAELSDFMTKIEVYVQDVVGGVLATTMAQPDHQHRTGRKSKLGAQPDSSEPTLPFDLPKRASNPTPATQPDPSKERQPTHPDQLKDLLPQFGLKTFRRYQEAVCRSVVESHDVLVVMPTGAGKSLCYQLPGLARAGTTLVVSPLIALMEDQVKKLKEVGLRSERIHSGRERSRSREVCSEYLAGKLDYLFIAPERLAVPGFPEMLARRKPVLVAIDEAHCISHWGHDFRPDYRMLGERLPLFRPAPVIALTATATPLVQQDIGEQLGLAKASHFIHGFRRTNIAVEIAEYPASGRRPIVRQLLSKTEHRPAIVYAPTRKEADALGELLQSDFPAATYHAGMRTAARERVQVAFLEGRIDVIVATVAFGMGVDKPNVRTVIHTGLPGSLEAYYQEIGRAGRDGLPSRAILLYSYADRRTHEFFHKRDYPETLVLQSLYELLETSPIPTHKLRQKLPLDDDVYAKALEKLWIHKGAVVDPDENVTRGWDGWQREYETQRTHRLDQLARITRFAETPDCRMLRMVQHFGDQEDSGEPCGGCDNCAPDACLVRRYRSLSATEAEQAKLIMQALTQRDGQSTGQIHRLVSSTQELSRREFERVLRGLVGAGLVEVSQDEFSKDGRLIQFERAALTSDGRGADASFHESVRLVQEPPKTAKRARKTRKTRKPTSKRSSKSTPIPDTKDLPPKLVEALREWRLSEARKRRTPAFHIFSDRTLRAIAAALPESEDALLAVPGIGPRLAAKYGKQVLAIIVHGSWR